MLIKVSHVKPLSVEGNDNLLGGQQVLTLGLATVSSFLPLDQDIFISTKKIQPQEFEDNRNTTARRYKQAKDLTKPELLALAVKRAIRNGFLKLIISWQMHGKALGTVSLLDQQYNRTVSGRTWRHG